MTKHFVAHLSFRASGGENSVCLGIRDVNLHTPRVAPIPSTGNPRRR
jgi:hypothetical protein